MDLNREALLRKSKACEVGLNSDPTTEELMYRVRDLNREALLRKSKACEVGLNSDPTTEELMYRVRDLNPCYRRERAAS